MNEGRQARSDSISRSEATDVAPVRKGPAGQGWLWPVGLFLLGLVARGLIAWGLEQPGYTDAYYYAVGAWQLYRGEGLTEPLIWNYLAPPATVTHPGYLYWMPLTAILGWLGLLVDASFRGLQGPFVLAAALLPPLTYLLAMDLATGLGLPARRQHAHALLAGLLAVVPGFYSHVLVLPDSFGPFALAGGLCLWAAGRGLRRGRAGWFWLAGLAAGMGHLARADGLLLLAVALLAALAQRWATGHEAGAATPIRRPVGDAALVLAGYLVVMAPWFGRNWLVGGRPLPLDGTRTLFLTTYDDLFAYGRPLDLESYLAWGLGPILGSKLQALALNLQRLWVEALLIVLPPFVALGLWRLRRERLLWPFLLYVPLLFLAMTLAFTFPGMRGGLYHSAAALLPFFFAVTGPGLEEALRLAARRLRGWQVRRAWPVFAAGLAGLAVLITVFGLFRAGIVDGEWNRRDRGYAAVGTWLREQGAGEATVMVGNAPGFAWHTGQPAIAVPNEPPETILAVADRYSARYLVLDAARPRTTDGLYAGQESHPRLQLVYVLEQWQLYHILP